MRLDVLIVRAAGFVAGASLAAFSCTSLRMTPPEETGGAGAGGTVVTGAAGDGGAGTGAGTGGTAGTGTAGTGAGTGGAAGTAGGGAAGTGAGAGGRGGVGGRGGFGFGGRGGMGGRGGNGGMGGRGGMGARGGAGGVGAGTGGSAGGTGGSTAGTGGSSAGAGGTIVEPANLIAFWRFNEGSGTTVADSSGNGQTLTLSADGGWITGHEGAGFGFDGASDVGSLLPVQGQPLLDYPTYAVTFSAWVKPDATAASRPFATAVARANEDHGFQDFWLGLANGKPACTIHSPTQEGAYAGTAAPTTSWTHIACSYGSSGVVALYVNGAFTAEFTFNDVLGPIPTAILVGASETAALQDFFPGAIDDVRIYDAELSSSEVATIAR